MSKALTIATILALLMGSACAAKKEPPVPGKQTQSGQTQAMKKILFFMNPNGYPCQQQYTILESMKAELNGVAEVEYIKTTVGGDMHRFRDYGIRGLPMIIIADSTGKTLLRFSPGIQNSESILNALNAK